MRTFNNDAPDVPKEIKSVHASIKHNSMNKDEFTWLARFSYDYSKGRMFVKDSKR